MTSAVRFLVLRSPAKINLGLAIGPKRPDGFHDITSIMVPLELHDTVRLEHAAAGIRVTTNRADLPTGPGNLAHRAAAGFFAAARLDAGCRIHITKRIPIGGGLGGGSSNAATVLMGLNRLFNQPLSERRLRLVAATLGSDVPVFLRPGASVARGRGEKLRPIHVPQLHVLLYFPGFGVPTAWAYGALDRYRARRGLTSFGFSPKILGASLRRNKLDSAARQVRNDFEPIVFRRHPSLGRVRKLMIEHGAFAAALSGSGSTVYGLVPAHGWKDPMASMKRHGFPCTHTRTMTA